MLSVLQAVSAVLKHIHGRLVEDKYRCFLLSNVFLLKFFVSDIEKLWGCLKFWGYLHLEL